MSKALLIMAHGSRSETANDEFRVLVDTVAESAHAAGQEYVAVLPCFLATSSGTGKLPRNRLSWMTWKPRFNGFLPANPAGYWRR